MTTLVRLAAYMRELGGQTPIGAGVLRFEYVAGVDGFLLVDGERVTIPTPFKVAIADGVPEAPVTLEPTAGRCAVRVQLEAAGFFAEWWFEIPAVDGIDFGELVDSHQVDPASFAPVVVTPTLVETIDARIDDRFVGFRRQVVISQADYDALPTTDPTTLYVIKPS